MAVQGGDQVAAGVYPVGTEFSCACILHYKNVFIIIQSDVLYSSFFSCFIVLLIFEMKSHSHFMFPSLFFI